MRSSLSALVALAIFVQACLYFYFAYCISLMYRAVHAAWPLVLTGTGDTLLKGGLLLVAAVLYLRVSAARPWLRLLALAGAVYGMLGFASIHTAVRSYWSIFERDIVATSAVLSLWFFVIAVLAIIDHLDNKLQPRRRIL